MEIASVKNLTFTYNGAASYALKDITFSVKKGELVLLCGKSGCGKTTLLRMLKPELTPVGNITGEIHILSHSADNVPQRVSAEKIGFVMQSPDKQIATQRVYSELALGLESMGKQRNEILRKTAEISAYFGIERLYRKDTSHLSGGEKQLVSLASVLSCEPELMILDEPFSSLDPIAEKELAQTVVRLNRELGLTVIIASHRIDELFEYADKIAVMDSGRMLFFDKPCKCVFSIADNPLIYALPVSARLYSDMGFKKEENCPLNIVQGRRFLSENLKPIKQNTIMYDTIENKGETALKLSQVYFRYEKTGDDIIRCASLEIQCGEIYAILGGNGTGKTTLLSLMSGVLHPYSGKIIVNGRKITKYRFGSLYRGVISAVPQEPSEMFVKDSVDEELREMLTDDNTELCQEIVVRLGLDKLYDRHPYDLSGGEQRKLAFAKALLNRPKILLLDEPTAGLDCNSRSEIIAIIKELAVNGISVVIVTHDAEFASECADRCALFFDGRIISEEGTKKFFAANSYYTTASVRLTKGITDICVTYEDILKRIGADKNKEVQ